MKCASWERTSGKREVDAGKRGAVGDFLDGCLFSFERGGDRGAGSVEGLAEGGFFLVGDIFYKCSGKSEGAFFAENGNTGIIERARIVGGGDQFEGGRLDGCDLLVHGRGRDSGEAGAGQEFADA